MGLLRAEKSMRDALAQETLASLALTLGRKAPARFGPDVQAWLSDRGQSRGTARTVPIAPQRADHDP